MSTADPARRELALEVVDVHRRYGAFEALRGVSFAVPSGEVFALLGVNGAGKTSVLEVVEGLAAADGGSVRTSASCCSPAGCPATSDEAPAAGPR